MSSRLLSHDLPRSRRLALALVIVVVALLVAPFAFPGVKALSVAAKALMFILLVASFDLLPGYTGIVSFAHTMFFGIGAYGVAIAGTRLGPGWSEVLLGTAAALVTSLLLSLLVGLFSLRVKAIFFAMITLAVASAFQTLTSQLSNFTGGEDGLSFRTPEWLSPAFELSSTPVLGLVIDGRILAYYGLFVAVALLFLALLRIVNSPFGRVLQAIRENDVRAEALGFRTVVYPTASNVISALFATLAGALLALWLRYVGPDTTLSFEIMLDILLIVVIGGMGTMYGAVVGAALFVLAQNYLQDLLRLASAAFEGVPLLGAALTPDRWLLWLGLLFVLSVHHFPSGIVGRLRAAVRRCGGAAMSACSAAPRSPAQRSAAFTCAAKAASCTSPSGATHKRRH
ncbi:MAG: branched-chain amino acid ABC transporter permease [Rubrivivax sp.]|nr:branched-chain amino acid ABC transporter permease [Rubrivivax sp.]